VTTHNAHLLIVMMLPDRAKGLGRVKKDPPGVAEESLGDLGIVEKPDRLGRLRCGWGRRPPELEAYEVWRGVRTRRSRIRKTPAFLPGV